MGLGKRHFCAVVFSDLERHSTAWTALPGEEAVVLIDTYRQTAETLSGRFGARHQNFTGDGHLFLFDSTDVAVQFGLSLIDAWDRLNGCDANSLRLRIGCHFGECAPLQDESAWIGRAIGLAKRVESIAAAGTLFVTESALESLDIPLYGYESAGRFSLKGDHLAERGLYRIMSVDQRALKGRGLDQISAEEAFLRGVASVGSSRAEYEEEAQWYREALKRRPDYPEAHNNLGIVLRRLGNEQEAAAHYREALRFRPDYPEADYNFGLLLASQGKLTGAIEHLGNSIRQREDNAAAYHALGNAYKVRGDAAEARHCYERTLAIRPGYAEAHNDFAMLLLQIGDYAGANEHCKEALRLRPDYAEAHYNFALVLEDTGHVVAAQKHYERALTLRPDYPEAHNNLAALLHTEGCLDEAEPHYEKALALRPDDPEAYHNYALLLRAKGDETRAQQYFALAKNLMPDSSRIGTVFESPR